MNYFRLEEKRYTSYLKVWCCYSDLASQVVAKVCSSFLNGYCSPSYYCCNPTIIEPIVVEISEPHTFLSCMIVIYFLILVYSFWVLLSLLYTQHNGAISGQCTYTITPTHAPEHFV